MVASTGSHGGRSATAATTTAGTVSSSSTAEEAKGVFTSDEEEEDEENDGSLGARLMGRRPRPNRPASQGAGAMPVGRQGFSSSFKRPRDLKLKDRAAKEMQKQLKMKAKAERLARKAERRRMKDMNGGKAVAKAGNVRQRRNQQVPHMVVV